MEVEEEATAAEVVAVDTRAAVSAEEDTWGAVTQAASVAERTASAASTQDTASAALM